MRWLWLRVSQVVAVKLSSMTLFCKLEWGRAFTSRTTYLHGCCQEASIPCPAGFSVGLFDVPSFHGGWPSWSEWSEREHSYSHNVLLWSSVINKWHLITSSIFFFFFWLAVSHSISPALKWRGIKLYFLKSISMYKCSKTTHRVPLLHDCLVIHQVFTKGLLCYRYCSRFWGFCSERNRWRFLDLCGSYFLAGGNMIN